MASCRLGGEGHACAPAALWPGDRLGAALEAPVEGVKRHPAPRRASRSHPGCPLQVGLDAAGKTTILYKLKLGEIVTTIPTIGAPRNPSPRPLRRSRRQRPPLLLQQRARGCLARAGRGTRRGPWLTPCFVCAPVSFLGSRL